MPKQAPPVRRPHFVEPHRAVDVVHGPPEQLVAMRMRLMHGANFNDPQYFSYPSFQEMKLSMIRTPPGGQHR